MNDHYLSEEEVLSIVKGNTYTVDMDMRLRSRCMSTSNYPESAYPAVSLPGGDLGDLAILYASADYYGFSVDYDAALSSLVELIDGDKNLTFSQAQFDIYGISNYYYYIFKNYENFELSRESREKLSEHFEKFSGRTVAGLSTSSQKASAAIFFTSSEGLSSTYKVKKREGVSEGHLYVLHKSFVDERHKLWVEKLLRKGVVELYEGLDAEYLYEVLSEMTDRHMLETLRNFDLQVPIFGISEVTPGNFQINTYQ